MSFYIIHKSFGAISDSLGGFSYLLDRLSFNLWGQSTLGVSGHCHLAGLTCCKHKLYGSLYHSQARIKCRPTGQDICQG